ncbi:hypothetical protein BDC45DRAFT_515495 [Circinella umbellata]|nr:hypothetical protein BDC45DRAFT_515495 [Circinella umbellata]
MTATVSQPVQNAIADTSVENGTKNPATLASQDVGLIFVREYYTFLNKNPHKLFGFYGNDSLMVRGDEGEVATTIRGQEEIRKKIDELGFNDCRVLVTQVDSQVSANDGILIQVLGEMCNMNSPVQKFSQTFFLAPQPNGYYVLNDIFRCLKDDVNIDYYTCEDNNKQSKTTEQPETPLPASETTTPATTITTSAPNTTTNTTNTSTTETGDLDSTAATTSSTPVIESAQPQSTITPTIEEPVKEKDEEEKEEEKSIKQMKKSETTAKTWANLAAGRNENKWVGGNNGSHSSPTSSSNVTTTTTTAAVPTTPEPKGSPPANVSQQQQHSSKHTKNHEHREHREQREQREQIPREEMVEVFLKNTKSLTNEQVKEVFTSEFGEVKSVNLLQGKNTGFLTFAVPESCQKALNQRKVTVGEMIVNVEERRPSKFNRSNGIPYERKFPHHRRGGGAPRGGHKSRGGGNQNKQ